MGSEAFHAAKVYRHLLKSVKKPIGWEDYKRQFSDFISEEFKKNHQLSDPTAIQSKLKLGRDYTCMLNSLHHHKELVLFSTSDLESSSFLVRLASDRLLQELLFSYNIAVDRTEEMKRVLGKSAASVGFQLPELYQS